MKIRATFVDSQGAVIATDVGVDWEQALDRAYSRLMKLSGRPSVHLVISTVK